MNRTRRTLLDAYRLERRKIRLPDGREQICEVKVFPSVVELSVSVHDLVEEEGQRSRPLEFRRKREARRRTVVSARPRRAAR